MVLLPAAPGILLPKPVEWACETPECLGPPIGYRSRDAGIMQGVEKTNGLWRKLRLQATIDTCTIQPSEKWFGGIR